MRRRRPAWKAIDRFQGRSALRSWLYRIATNVCLDMIAGRERRAARWIGPAREPVCQPQRIARGDLDRARRTLIVPTATAEVTAARETVRLAFVAALQHLRPGAAVLILCEVRAGRPRRQRAAETSVASVNSAPAARAALDANDLAAETTAPSVEQADADLLARRRRVRAHDRTVAAVVHEDATQSMPPYDMAPRPTTSTLVVRPGNRLQRLAHRSGACGERLAGIRAVQAERDGERVRPVGAPGARGGGRVDRRAHVLSRHRSRVPAVRPAAAPSLTSTSSRPMNATSAMSSGDAFRSRTLQR